MTTQSSALSAPIATIEVDLRTAVLIRRAFVPHNPRRMRNTTDEVRQAAMRFIELVEHATLSSGGNS